MLEGKNIKLKYQQGNSDMKILGDNIKTMRSLIIESF